VLLTKSVGVYVERSARDYPRLHCALMRLTVHRGTAWLSTIRSSNTCEFSQHIFTPSVYRISTIKLAVNNEDGSN